MRSRGTPGNIPNPEVKPWPADDTGRTCGWESKWVPPLYNMEREVINRGYNRRRQGLF